jgi:aminobenzoyl-glutamate utilization protein B
MMNLPEGTEIFTGVSPMRETGKVGGGSTDVGDVAHIVPTASFGTATDNLGAPGHSWQITLCSGMSIGHKGMIYAAKAMADAAGKLLRDPDLVEKAKAEFWLNGWKALSMSDSSGSLKHGSKVDFSKHKKKTS